VPIESSTHRFPIQRIAVTVPPEHWFHGIARAMFAVYREALVELGFEIFDVPVEPFLGSDDARILNLISDLRKFRPQLAFGLSKGSYALICRLPRDRDGFGAIYSPNFWISRRSAYGITLRWSWPTSCCLIPRIQPSPPMALWKFYGDL
jgi:hypothetical protein